MIQWIIKIIQKIESKLSVPRWRATLKSVVLFLSLLSIISLPVILFFIYTKYPDWQGLSIAIFILAEVGLFCIAYRTQIKKGKNMRTKFVWRRIRWLG